MASNDYISKPEHILAYEISLFPYHKAPLAIRRHLDVNYRFEDATGDGNCLFRAISLGLYGNQDHHGQLRQEACDVLTGQSVAGSAVVDGDNSDILANNNRRATIISTCREPGAWGEHPHIVAIARKHKARIVVYSVRTKRWFVSAEPKDVKETKHLVWLRYVDDAHYGGYVFVLAQNARSRPMSASLRSGGAAAAPTWNAAHAWFGDSTTSDVDDGDIDTARLPPMFHRSTTSAVSTSTNSTAEGGVLRRLKTADDFLRAIREMRSEMEIREQALD